MLKSENTVVTNEITHSGFKQDSKMEFLIQNTSIEFTKVYFTSTKFKKKYSLNIPYLYFISF